MKLTTEQQLTNALEGLYRLASDIWKRERTDLSLDVLIALARMNNEADGQEGLS
jgi:hypothetical protein